MISTSPSDPRPAPSLITKHTNHPLTLLLLGTVTGAHWMGQQLVLYYADGHKAVITHDNDGDISVEDYPELKTC